MTDSKQLVMHHLFLWGPRWRPSAQLRLSGEVFSSGMTQEKWNRDGKCGLVELGDQGSGWVGVTRLRSLSSTTNSANLTSELQQESMHNDVSATEGCWIHAIKLATIIYSMTITEYTPFLTLIRQVTLTSLQTASMWNHLQGYQYFGQEKHYFFQFIISKPSKSLLAHWVLSYEWFSEACNKPHLQNRLIMKRSLRLNCYSVNTFYGYHLESVSNPPRFRCNDAYLSDCASAYSKRKPNRRSTQSATVAKGADDCLHRFRWLHWTCGVLEYSKPIAFIRVSNLMTLDDVNLSRHHKLELEDWIHSIVCWSGWERNALNNMQYRLKTEWNRLWVLVDFVMRQEKVYKLIEMAS